LCLFFFLIIDLFIGIAYITNSSITKATGVSFIFLFLN